jgi:hypothetical protein
MRAGVTRQRKEIEDKGVDKKEGMLAQFGPTICTAVET